MGGESVFSSVVSRERRLDLRPQIWRRWVLLHLDSVLRWLEPDVLRRMVATASFNKWPASSLLCELPPLARFPLPRRGGGGGKDGRAGDVLGARKAAPLSLFLAFWSDAKRRSLRYDFCCSWWTEESIEVVLGCLNKLLLVVLSGRPAPSLATAIHLCLFSTAPRWPWAGSPSTVLAEGRSFRAMTNPAASWRLHCYNLQAVVPKGRPYSPAISAFFGALVPSGFVPGDYGVGRDRRRIRRFFSGLGPDCVLSDSFGVCSGVCKSLRDLFVICTTVLI